MLLVWGQKLMKKICEENNIPTENLNLQDKRTSWLFFKTCTLPIVVKADGLAAGKGVSICKTKKDVIDNSIDIFNGKFKSSKKVILEEFLDGVEVSYFLVVDNNSYQFWTAQDHKRVYENDKGPNTGDNAYSPALLRNH